MRLDLSTEVDPSTTKFVSASITYAGTLTLSHSFTPRVRGEVGFGVSDEYEVGGDFNELILTGKPMDAFEEFYADNIEMCENFDEPCVGKEANRKRELDFFAKIMDIWITFETDSQGRATALVVHTGGNELRAKRVN